MFNPIKIGNEIVAEMKQAIKAKDSQAISIEDIEGIRRRLEPGLSNLVRKKRDLALLREAARKIVDLYKSDHSKSYAG